METQAGALRLALDIGTRKVLGLAFVPEGDGARVVAAVRREHAGRAMRDGQIHDVPAVAAVLRAVVEELQAETGQRFTEAYVAAAGRALLTAPGEAESPAGEQREITAAAVRELEWEAVAAAQSGLQASLPAMAPGSGYYCVGHSITGFRLDGEPIGSLTGQWGRRAAVRVLATFLPRGVVDALEAALTQADLEMAGLTLEPIGALEAVVAPTMRYLNLVLVDVGAGTSDIAVTAEGTVQAYAMVPQAGDAVTEALARELLLDFAVAETAKRKAAGGRSVTVRNVLGERLTLTPALLEAATAPAVAELGRRIGQAILAANGRSPSAVLLVGGGSLTPGLPAAVAAALDLPERKVAVRNRQAIRGVSGGPALKGPDVATPFGIALLAARTGHLPLVRVQVGERRVRLFQPQRCTVGEALRVAGVPRAALVGRLGPGLTLTVNGELRVVPGGRATPGQVWLNGAPATLETPCPDRSQVTWEPARDGAPATVTVRELLREADWLPLLLDGEPVRVPPLVSVNGRPAALDAVVPDRAEVMVRRCATLGEAMAQLGLAAPAAPVTVRVNGQPVTLAGEAACLTVAGLPADEATPLCSGDQLVREQRRPTVAAALAAAGVQLPAPVPVRVNGRRVLVRPPVLCRRGGEPVSLDQPVADGDELVVEVPGGWRPLLHEALPEAFTRPIASPFGEGDLPPGRGRLVLLADGAPAGFTTPLAPNMEVEVRWE